MSFLFKSRQKSPQELAHAIKESIVRLDGQDKRKASDEISKILVSMKAVLYGDGDNDPVPDLVAQLSQEIYYNNVLEALILNLSRLDFEAKKDVAQIFNNLLRRQIGNRYPTVEYLRKHENILFALIRGYEYHEVALNCGMILRECVRHEPLARIVLYSSEFNNFFSYIESNTFDISSDAFATFKEILTRHKACVAEYLTANYDTFFEQYTASLLESQNYVVRRQSLKLLGELLLDRANFAIMTRYIVSVDNLKLMMNMLRNKSKNIQYEAFHVFKVFVANPKKTRPILDILRKNQEKLITYLSNFQTDRTEDEQFNDEKTFLIKQIEELPPL